MSIDVIEPGHKLGPYEILREIGRGGMGVVYKAHEPALNRSVAVKVLPDHLASNPGFLQRFTREAQSAAALQHPGIVAIYSVGKEDKLHYIAMEFINGRTLAEQLEKDGPVEINRALEIAAQICDALAEAHAKDIIHRDIKPHNIMLDEKGRVKMTDFGLAKAMNDQTLTTAGFILGTPTHMSPEQCNGQNADHRSDLYSVGVVLYEMLTGEAPYTGETPLSLMRQIADMPFPNIREKLPEVPDNIVRIIEHFVAKDPEKRFQSGELAAEDLRAAMAGKTPRNSAVHHDPTVLVAALPEFRNAMKGRRRAMMMGAVGALVFVLVLWGSLRVRRAVESMQARPAEETVEVDHPGGALGWESPETPAYVSPFDEPDPAASIIGEPLEPAALPLEPEPVAESGTEGLPDDLLSRVRTGETTESVPEPAAQPAPDPAAQPAPQPAPEPVPTTTVPPQVQKWTDVLKQVDQVLSGESSSGGPPKGGPPGKGKKGKSDDRDRDDD